MKTTYTPLRLFWVSPRHELYDALSAEVPLPPTAWKEGRWAALYRVNEDVGYYQINDITFIKQNQPNDLSIPEGSLGIKLYYGFSNSETPFHKTTVIDILRSEGWNAYHASIESGSVNDPLLVNRDRDLFIETIKGFDPSQSLAFVNGVYHDTVIEPDTKRLFVRDGYATIQKDRLDPSISLIDFSPLGSIIKLPFNRDWIVDQSHPEKGFLLKIPDYDLTQYTVCLINDGRFYIPGDHLQITGSHSAILNVGGIKFYRDFYRSPCLKRKLGYYVDPNVAPKSDVHDDNLGLWIGKTSLPTEYLASTEFILERLTSIHSLFLLLPKGTVFYPYPIEAYDPQNHCYTYPYYKQPENSVLMSNGLIHTPVFLKSDSYNKRSFLFDPRSSDFYDDPLDDPLRGSDYSPDRSIKTWTYKQRYPKLYSIIGFYSESLT